jgi:hypothetical protein
MYNERTIYKRGCYLPFDYRLKINVKTTKRNNYTTGHANHYAIIKRNVVSQKIMSMK